jgi:Endonuclease-reverse transcriptase
MSSFPHTLLFWNCQSLRSRVTDLQYVLASPECSSLFAPYNSPGLVALVETRCVDAASLPRVAGYSWTVHAASATRGGGVALLYHSSVACGELLSLPGLEAENEVPGGLSQSSSAVMWRLIRFAYLPPFVLGIIYLAPGAGVNTVSSLLRCINAAISLSMPVLLVGDFNLHHRLWHCPLPATPASAAFADGLSVSNWCVLNGILMPEVITRPSCNLRAGPGSIIDLAISSDPSLVSSMTVPTNALPYLESDHLPILLEFRPVPRYPPPALAERPRIHWWIHHRNWRSHFAAAVSAELESFPIHLLRCEPMDSVDASRLLERLALQFEQSLLQCACDTIGIRRPSLKAKHWYAYPGVAEAQRQLSAARHLCSSSATPEMLEQYRRARLRWQKIKKEALQHCWAELCSAVQQDPHSPVKWAMFKNTMPSAFCPVRSVADVSGTLPLDHRQSLANVASYLATVPAYISAPAEFVQALDPGMEDFRGDYDFFVQCCLSGSLPAHESDDWRWSGRDVANQCLHQHERSAPGPDSVLPVMLAHAGDAAFRALASLFNFSWWHGAVPRAWRQANVIPIYKGAGSRSDAASFRPLHYISDNTHV